MMRLIKETKDELQGTAQQAWLLKTQDEVAATKWAEESKKKAFQDALDARLGDEVKAAKEAIKNGTDVGEAIRKASEESSLRCAALAVSFSAIASIRS